MPSNFMTAHQVQFEFPGLTPARLARWRWAKTGPSPCKKIGRQILYRRDTIEAYLAGTPASAIAAGAE